MKFGSGQVLVGLLDFKSSGGQTMSVVGSIPMHFRQLPKHHVSFFLWFKSAFGLLKWYNKPNLFNISKKEKTMFGIGMPELLIILVIILIIFGAGKLPQIGEGIGKGIRNFKKATTKDKDEEIEVTPKKTEEISEKK